MPLPMTKSPLDFTRRALSTAREALPVHSGKFAKRTYTQYQLFALLAIKKFFDIDYRGLVQIITEWRELRQAIGLKKVPHYTAIQKAHGRLLDTQKNLLDSFLTT